jgi:hypothetical protein
MEMGAAILTAFSIWNAKKKIIFLKKFDKMRG